MGDIHLLLIEATRAQNDALLIKFQTTNVDINAKGEPCIDRFIDIVGRRPIEMAVCKGFLEMNMLNKTLLERLMVGDWNCDKDWIEDALSTQRTKALMRWKEEAKNARKDRRKRAAQDRDAERAAKKAKAEEEKARLAAIKTDGDDQDEDGDHDAVQVEDNTLSKDTGAQENQGNREKDGKRFKSEVPSPLPKKVQVPSATPSKQPNNNGPARLHPKDHSTKQQQKPRSANHKKQKNQKRP